MKKVITIAILTTIYSPFITYGQKVLEHTIIFDVNRWKIEEKILPEIQAVQDFIFFLINSYEGKTDSIVINGNASVDGPIGWNKTLSTLRAENCRRALLSVPYTWSVQNHTYSLFNPQIDINNYNEKAFRKSDIQIYFEPPKTVQSTPLINNTNICMPNNYSVQDIHIEPYQTTTFKCEKEGNFHPILSIGTNIIYDLLLMPTILIEYLPKFSHFSIMGEATFPWYKQEKHHQYFQLQRYSLFVKYHPLTKGCYNGWFIAPYLEAGLYDLEEKLGWFNFSHPNKEGYQGEFWGAGISAGFSMPFAKNRAKIEFRGGIGYIHSKYRKYVSYMEIYPYIQSKKLNYFGPTQLSISIHWNILNRKY